MPKDEWGVKRVCPSCGVRFYDLAADPVICPACEASFALASLNDRKQTAAAAEPKPKPKKPAAKKFVADDDDDELVVDDADDDDDLDIGDDVLIDDDEDEDDEDLGEIGDVKVKGEDET